MARRLRLPGLTLAVVGVKHLEGIARHWKETQRSLRELCRAVQSCAGAGRH